MFELGLQILTMIYFSILVTCLLEFYLAYKISISIQATMASNTKHQQEMKMNYLDQLKQINKHIYAIFQWTGLHTGRDFLEDLKTTSAMPQPSQKQMAEDKTETEESSSCSMCYQDLRI